MDVSLKELDASEFELAGDMLSLHEPPRFWKVIVDDVIHCVCVSEEHAGAIAHGLKKAKALGDHLDLKLNDYQLWAREVVVARCSSKVIKRLAFTTHTELFPKGTDGPP